MRQISVTEEGNQYSFGAGETALSVSWQPSLELDFEASHALSFEAEMSRILSHQLEDAGLTPAEVKEAINQFTALRAKE